MNATLARHQLVELGKSLHERGITPGRTGNLSRRVEGGFLITPTGTSLGRLQPDQLAFLDERGALKYGPEPSKEWSLHLACYQRDPAVGAVAHVHSLHAVAASILADTDPHRALPPLTGYFVMRVGRLPLLPYLPPGDPALADALRALPGGIRCALLANHGSIAGAEDLDSAVDAVEEIEQTAALHLLTARLAVRPLTSDQVAATSPR